MVTEAISANGLPRVATHVIGGRKVRSAECFDKRNPHDGSVLCQVSRGGTADVEAAVAAARAAFAAWSSTTPVARGEVLFAISDRLAARREDVARIVALETGKSQKHALGETDGAIALGRFMAGEGRRLYGRTTTSAASHRNAMTVREPLGVAGLIIAANTPIANVAWKVFPALICGNTAVLKAAEDTPLTAWVFSEIAHEAGLPTGVLNVLHGYGPEVGRPLVEHPLVPVLSFTGSTAVGREIAAIAGRRLARVSLELGGKNPFVVCDDADLASAVEWAAQSAFSNAGQRCASGSRIIVQDDVYDEFRDALVTRARAMRVGNGDEDDFGPVINERQLANMLAGLDAARARGARVVLGGHRLGDDAHRAGCYMAPTIVEDVPADDDFSCHELFGPITALYRARDFEHAVALANSSPYGLTASIHTSSLHRALEFTRRVESGVVSINAGTFGSEPHMPFGGVKSSGNGTREPGTEALDVYSNLKDVYVSFDPAQV